ncbi:SDR family oxidoreductase [Yinghuangia seranimata]|uniref:SDR family oxidoreductase n=1 Tax=Yinghuangia seranimata TaxID=408067 RepID=UPI00248AC7FD|nr:SDR family oxidoreductase [Yinghuangia seranimata]MDI2128116.1 SDR family oxidoreductase [Yinghuangia seranimata]
MTVRQGPGGALVVGGSDIARAVRDALRAAGTVVGEAASGGGLAADAEAAGIAADGVELVVYAPYTPGSALPRAVVDMSAQEWDRLAEQPVRDGLAALQAAHPLLKAAAERRGEARFVLVAPSVAIEGGAGVVPLATAAESLRALAKSAARRWARDGVAVHLLAPTVFALDAEAEALRGSDVDRSEAALGAEAMSPEAVAEVVLLLCGPGARYLTGGTFPLDGGALMVP